MKKITALPATLGSLPPHSTMPSIQRHLSKYRVAKRLVLVLDSTTFKKLAFHNNGWYVVQCTVHVFFIRTIGSSFSLAFLIFPYIFSLRFFLFSFSFSFSNFLSIVVSRHNTYLIKLLSPCSRLISDVPRRRLLFSLAAAEIEKTQEIKYH